MCPSCHRAVELDALHHDHIDKFIKKLVRDRTGVTNVQNERPQLWPALWEFIEKQKRFPDTQTCVVCNSKEGNLKQRIKENGVLVMDTYFTFSPSEMAQFLAVKGAGQTLRVRTDVDQAGRLYNQFHSWHLERKERIIQEVASICTDAKV